MLYSVIEMTPLSLFGLGSFLVAGAVGIVIGAGRRRQFALAAFGVAFWGGWAVWALTAGCEEGDDCWLGVVVFGALAAIWLAGVGAVALVRSDVGEAGWRTSAAGCTLLGVVATVLVVDAYGYEIKRLGCPSDEELNRVQSVEEVADAFARGDLPLERFPVSALLPPNARGARGATALRHVTSAATLYVVVCRQGCTFNRFRPVPGGQRRRLGIDSNNNVVVWVTEDDGRAGRRLVNAILEPLREVHPYVASASRCYIG